MSAGVAVKLVFDRTGEVSAATHRILSQVVRKTALDVQAIAVDSMSGPKHGNITKRGGKTHQASAPGEPPARDIGNLAGSIGVAMLNPLTAEVTVGADYGIKLELGDHDTEARPYMAPAVDAVAEPFQQACRAAVKKGAGA